MDWILHITYECFQYVNIEELGNGFNQQLLFITDIC